VAILGFLLIAAAPAVGALMRREALIERDAARRLDQDSVVTSATVSRLKRESKDSNRATAAYQFSADGRVFDGRAKVPMSVWRQLSVGDALPVRYVPTDPALNTPDGVTPPVMPPWVPWPVAVALLIGGVGCHMVLARSRRLLADGRVAHAIVRAHKVTRTQHGTHRSMTYDFPLLNGARVTGRGETSRTPPAIGTSIIVLYDAESPRVNKPYPFKLVRLDVY
jgi:hypothetical protein